MKERYFVTGVRKRATEEEESGKVLERKKEKQRKSGKGKTRQIMRDIERGNEGKRD